MGHNPAHSTRHHVAETVEWRPMNAGSLGLSHFSSMPLGLHLPSPYCLRLLPVEATLHWTRPSHRTLLEMLSHISDSFGRILIYLRVTGYPVRQKLDEPPLKDVLQMSSTTRRALLRASCVFLQGPCGAWSDRFRVGGKGIHSDMIQIAE